jgi:aryl-alcohol dehydrogenase-like predicted oxidoreductase
MKQKILGSTGLRVSELSLGTMTFGEDFGWGSSIDESRQVFNTFLDKGGNFIDTADFYTNGSSEKLIGEFSQGIRDRLVITSKYTFSTDPQHNSNAGGNQRKHMVQAVEQSLRRLKTDYIDLYMVHIWDRLTPFEEIIRGLDDLVSSGKILYAGMSDAPAWWIAKANQYAEWHGRTKFSTLQMEYNLVERGIEREILPLARHDDLAIMAWSPLASGLLSGKYKTEKDAGQSKRGLIADARLNAHTIKIIDVLNSIAGQLHVSPAAVALKWLMLQHHQVFPIVGARTVKQLTENFSSLDISLESHHLQMLDEVSKINLGFPYDILEDTKPGLPGMSDGIHGIFKEDMLAEIARRSGKR